MNLTISNPANRYFNLSNPTKLIADAIYVFQKKKRLSTNKKLKKDVYFVHFELH